MQLIRTSKLMCPWSEERKYIHLPRDTSLKLPVQLHHDQSIGTNKSVPRRSVSHHVRIHESAVETEASGKE